MKVSTHRKSLKVKRNTLRLQEASCVLEAIELYSRDLFLCHLLAAASILTGAFVLPKRLLESKLS